MLMFKNPYKILKNIVLKNLIKLKFLINNKEY